MSIIKEAYEGELAFLENSLELDILERDMVTEVGRMEAFYEDGDESSENEGIIEKVSAAITRLLIAIGNMIKNFIRVIGNLGKKHADFDDYMATDVGAAEWNQRYMQSCKEIDEYMTSCRPCISAIANITNCDIESVEKTCDTLNRIVEKADWEKIAKGAIKRKSSSARWKKYADEALGWNDRLSKANQEFKSGKKTIKDKKRRIKALEKMTVTQNKFTSKLFGSFSKE